MEIWDCYDSNGQLVEGVTLTRGEAMPIEYRHLVVDVVVEHVDGSYLMMKRSYSKHNYPGFWEIGAGGSAVQGESSLDAVVRELKEETGITPTTLMQVYRRISQDCICDVYLAVTDCDKDSIVTQPEETIDYKWVTKDELIKFFYTYQCIYAQQRNLADFINNVVDFRILSLAEHIEYQPLASEWVAKRWHMTNRDYFATMRERKPNSVTPQWYIAMEGYRLVGILGVVDYDNHAELEITPNLCGLYVEEDCRGRGIARALLNYAQEDMQAKGVDKLYLLTKTTGYYEKLGYKYLKQVGERKVYCK